MRRAHAFAIGVAFGVAIAGHSAWSLVVGVAIAFGPFALIGAHAGVKALGWTDDTHRHLALWPDVPANRCPGCGVPVTLWKPGVAGRPHLHACHVAAEQRARHDPNWRFYTYEARRLSRIVGCPSCGRPAGEAHLPDCPRSWPGSNHVNRVVTVHSTFAVTNLADGYVNDGRGNLTPVSLNRIESDDGSD